MQDELTLKELILGVQDYLRYFLRKWYWFVLGVLLVGGVFFYNAYTTLVNYPAPLTFMLNDNKEAAIGAGAILGSLGLGLGGGDGGGGSASKLLELAKSRKVLGRVLFDSVVIDGKARLVANYIIDTYDYHLQWEKNESLKDFYFGNGIPAADDVVGNRVFKTLHRLLVNEEDGLVSLTADEFSGVFDLRANTLSPELSVALVNLIYDELSIYFVSTSVSGKEKTLGQLTMRADSVKAELSAAESRLARFQDRSSGILLRQDVTRGQELNRQVLILSALYGEIIKNKETAAFLLANEKPAFSLIDGPLAPLNSTEESIVKALVIGGLLGGVLMGIMLFFTKLFSDAMWSQ